MIKGFTETTASDAVCLPGRRIVRRIEKAFRYKKVVFIDVESAFENIGIDLIRAATGNILNWRQ
jgi:hypothetical protein